MHDVTVTQLRAEYRAGRALGIGDTAPRLSWIVATAAPGWRQAAYEVELDGVSTGWVEGDRSVFVPWPGAPLASRRQAVARVRVWGADGSASPWSAGPSRPPRVARPRRAAAAALTSSA